MTLRAVGTPRPVRVEDAAPHGVPGAVVMDGRRRVVVAVRDDWLVQDLWWTDRPVDRHYFELVVEPGRVLVTYRDAAGGWFAHA